MKEKRERWGFAVAFILLFAAEAGIALFVHDRFVRPYLGDVLVVILLYCLIRAVFPKGFLLLPGAIFLFAVGVEVLQYFHFVEKIGLGRFTLARVLLGTSFSFWDILCYFVGCLLCALFEWQRAVRRP